MTTSTLPTEPRPIRIDPELGERIEKLLKPLTGDRRKAADAAVMEVYQSGHTGSFTELLELYESAIAEAVEAA